jgi:hypothetical protein
MVIYLAMAVDLSTWALKAMMTYVEVFFGEVAKCKRGTLSGCMGKGMSAS